MNFILSNYNKYLDKSQLVWYYPFFSEKFMLIFLLQYAFYEKEY